MLICGLDEAGRGSVLGPLVVACAVYDSNTKNNAQDSKKLSQNAREAMYDTVLSEAKEVVFVELSAKGITDLQCAGLTLNEIEVELFAEAINMLTTRPDHVFLDAADVIPKRFATNIRQLIDKPIAEWTSEHRADDTYPVVGAASIVAKVHRDAAMKRISEKYNCDLGKGYPSEKKTRDWLSNIAPDFAPEVRTQWATVKNILSLHK